MSWAAVAGAAIGVVGSAIAADSASDAADAQVGASKEATQLQKDMYDETVARNKPFVEGGRAGFDQLLMQLGLAGDKNDPNFGMLSRQVTADEVMNSPGYQFGLDQGQNALARQLNARGLNASGAALKAATRYGNDYATTKFGENFSRVNSQRQDIYNRLMGVTDVGQSAANNTSASGNIFASQAGQNMIGAGNAQAANSLAQGSIWGNALNQGLSIYNNNRRGNSSGDWVNGSGKYAGFVSDDYGVNF